MTTQNKTNTNPNAIALDNLLSLAKEIGNKAKDAFAALQAKIKVLNTKQKLALCIAYAVVVFFVLNPEIFLAVSGIAIGSIILNVLLKKKKAKTVDTAVVNDVTKEEIAE